MNKLQALLYGAGIGAGLMYFFDPVEGNRRRTMVQQKAMAAVNDTRDGWEAGIQDLRNRSRGLMYEARSAVQQGQENLQNVGEQASTDGQLTPGIRLLMEAGGGLLTLYGRARGGITGGALSLVGLGLVARGVTNMGIRRMLGIGDQPGTIDIWKAINIDLPVDEAYNFWTHFENFPRFMENVKEVRDLGNNRTHWVVSGPAGANMEWDAITTQEMPDQMIAWESEPDSQVKTTGEVKFRPNQKGGTRITVHMTYTPPAGVIGHAVATLFGANPKQEMDSDLNRMKTLLEEGKTSAKGRSVKRQDLGGATAGAD